MITKQLLEGRLKDRVNRKFKDSESFEFFIDQYSLTDNKPTVWCDNDPADFISYEECNSWLNTLKEIPGAKREVKSSVNEKSLAPTQKPALPATQSQALEKTEYSFKINGAVLNEAKDIVLANIKKLQGDNGADFIPQAKEIDAQIQTIMDLAKTEIQVARTMIDLERG